MEERIGGKKLDIYVRGIDAIATEADNMVYYYILNEHGDVPGLRNQGGICEVSYEYGAFRIERNPNKEDDNTIKQVRTSGVEVTQKGQ